MNIRDEQDPQVYDFGWWPEILGLALIALMIWRLVSQATGDFQSLPGNRPCLLSCVYLSKAASDAANSSSVTPSPSLAGMSARIAMPSFFRRPTHCPASRPCSKPSL